MRSRALALAAAFAIVGAVISSPLTAAPAGATGLCGPPVVNPVACENTKVGDPPSDWQVTGAGDPALQGFSTQMSAQAGDTISFKVNATASAYHVDILRFGYYQGNGARKVATLTGPFAVHTQPACNTDSTTGLVDCGNWSVAFTWTVPTGSVSGLYAAHLVRNDNGNGSIVPFVVRDDSSHSAIVVQTSDETWQAYNTYGGNSLYQCTVACPPGNPEAYKGAFKVSYNRPFHTAEDDSGRSWITYTELPMIEFLEQNGYDVSYMSGNDVDQHGALLLNHKTFMSSGHDEYWSGNQRANVEAARDHGVNLAFFSGNEIFWKTRWEADSSGTSNRILVAYKDTHLNAATDPVEWTGSWADPRFSPPGNGGRPENALSGQFFDVNSGTTDIQVPSQYANLRMWRNTSIASLTAGQTATLGAGLGTLGYEWDIEPDNGFRPAGEFDLSSTTSNNAEVFTDYGSETSLNQTATHHLSLYKASSGALVFGAGTVQWAWGLASLSGGAVDPNMQQATINLLADMGAQPATLMAGMVAATASTDTTAPTSTITSPSTGANLSDGASVTVTGTAHDTGGGVVAGVEVSTDGGTTWHPATGTTSWSYTWSVNTGGATTIMSRATDDSGNIETPSAGVHLTGHCPCSLFGSTVPSTVDAGDAGASVELGLKFTADESGNVTGVRFYKSAANTGVHTGTLWSATGTQLATVTFSNESASGWQQATFATPVAVTAGTTYVVSYHTNTGHYSYTGNAFYGVPVGNGLPAYNSPPLHAPLAQASGGNGLYDYGASVFPTESFKAANYWVDVTFSDSAPVATAPDAPTGVTAVAANASATVSWTAPASNGAAITSYTVTPFIGATAQTPTTVSGSVTSTTITGLTNGTTYTFKVAATNSVGTGPASAASNAVTPSAAAQTFTLFGATVPTTVDAGDAGASVELGLKFTADVSGSVTGVRFYKSAANIGTHTGTLWSAAGAQLATATFANETASGWQTVSFSSPVAVTAGTTYVVSYHTTAGHYSYNSQAFTTQFDNAPLHALASGSSGGNGVYGYGASAFPTQSFNAANYWVDVTFSNSAPAPTAPGAPTGVTATAGNASASVSWTASASNGSAITSYTVTPFIGAAAQTPTTVSGSLTSTTITGLTNGTSYTFTVTATNGIGTGPASAASNAVTPSAAGQTFTLFGNTVPTTVDAGDAGASVELGLKFTADTSGSVTGVRFYKSAANTGTHTGTLWSAAGAQLATVTFTGETASGWQTANFSSPVAVTAGTTYVVSYHTTTGHYSYNGNAFATQFDNAPLHALASGSAGGNGVYGYGASAFPTQSFNAANYWVDVTFSNSAPAPTAPGAPTGVTATAGNASASVSWTAPASNGSAITSYTVTPFIGAAAQTPTTVSGSLTTTSITGLTNGTTYTFKVSATNSVGTGPSSAASNAVTPSAVAQTFTLFGNSVPATVDAGDAGANVELGVKFTTDVSGSVTGVRFYKSAANTGVHTGTLWSSTGVQLATATFSNETASGWQTVSFSSPVPVTAGTTYVVSYHTTVGHYSYNGQAFASQVDNAPLHALASGSSGGNGVYGYGASAFPTQTFNSANYWVDVTFTNS